MDLSIIHVTNTFRLGSNTSPLSSRSASRSTRSTGRRPCLGCGRSCGLSWRRSRIPLNPASAYRLMSTESAIQHGSTTDAYRIFFPLGLALGVTGVSVWPLYYFGITEGYNGRTHAFVQICGFLYSFAAGFLLTAIPRFTKTEPPGRRIQYLLPA